MKKKRKYNRRKAVEKIVEDAISDKRIGLMCPTCLEEGMTIKESALKRARDKRYPVLPSEVTYADVAMKRNPDRVCTTCPVCFDELLMSNPRGGFVCYPAHLQKPGERYERFPTVDGSNPGIYLTQPYSADPTGTMARLVHEAVFGAG